MAGEQQGGTVPLQTFQTLDSQYDFVTTSTSNQGSVRRKSRRSWFEKSTGARIEIAVENKPKRRSGENRRKSEDDVETLLLTHFTNPPRIGFGVMKPCGLKRRHLLIKNPHDYPQDVKIEKFPFKKNFDIDETNFTVEAEETYLLTITWTPESEGNFREMILFIVDKSYRLQAFVFGAVEKPPQKKKIRRGLVGRNAKNPFSIIQTGALSNIAKSYSPTKEEKRRSAEKILNEKGKAKTNKGKARGQENIVPAKRMSKEKKAVVDPSASVTEIQNSTAIDQNEDRKVGVISPVMSPIKFLMDVEKTEKLMEWKSHTLKINDAKHDEHVQESEKNLRKGRNDEENVEDVAPTTSPDREERARPTFLSPNSFLQDSLCSQQGGEESLLDLQIEISRQPTHSTVLPTPEKMVKKTEPMKMILSPDTFLKELNNTQEKLHDSLVLDSDISGIIPSPEKFLDKSIPHDIMVRQLESVKASLQQEKKKMEFGMQPPPVLSPVAPIPPKGHGFMFSSGKSSGGNLRRETFVKGSSKNPFKEMPVISSPRHTTFIMKGKATAVSKPTALSNKRKQDIQRKCNARVKKGPQNNKERNISEAKPQVFTNLKSKRLQSSDIIQDNLEMSPIPSVKEDHKANTEISESTNVESQLLTKRYIQAPVINSATVSKTTPKTLEESTTSQQIAVGYKPASGKRLFSPDVCKSLGIEYHNVSIGSPHQILDTPTREVLTRRTTLTVKKERPSDALLQATQKSIAACLFSDSTDKSYLKDVRQSPEKSYSTSHLQSEDPDIVPGLLADSIDNDDKENSFPVTPHQLPTSPNPDNSRRSTHVVENPKVLDPSRIDRKRLFPPLEDPADNSVMTTFTVVDSEMLVKSASVYSMADIPTPERLLMHVGVVNCAERKGQQTVSSKSISRTDDFDGRNTSDLDVGTKLIIDKCEKVAMSAPVFSMANIPTPERLLMHDGVLNSTEKKAQWTVPSRCIPEKDNLGGRRTPDLDVIVSPTEQSVSQSPLETSIGEEPKLTAAETPESLESFVIEEFHDNQDTEGNCITMEMHTKPALQEPKELCVKDEIPNKTETQVCQNLDKKRDPSVSPENSISTGMDSDAKTIRNMVSKPKDVSGYVGFISLTSQSKKSEISQKDDFPISESKSTSNLPKKRVTNEQRLNRDLAIKKIKTAAGTKPSQVVKSVTDKQNANKKTGKLDSVKKSTGRPKSVPGVAQSKLLLMKKSKPALPKHPMPFASKNMYYDERWMEKQERGFVHWLNFVLTPSEEYHHSDKKIKVDAGALWLDTKQPSIKLAPTKEVLSFRAYAARRRLNQLRRSACKLFQSKEVVHVIQKLEAEIESLRLVIRKDKMVHADLGMKQNMLDMILSFNPLWLRIGLETVYGEMIPMQNNSDVIGLSRFIVTRLLSNPDISAAYSHPTVPHLYRDGYAEAIAQHLLKKVFMLIFFLDQAKSQRLINHDPCLFCKDSEFKTTKAMLIQFSRDYLSGEGDVTRHLAYFGYVVRVNQTAMDEFNYAVSKLAVDLRDGVRITRVIELLTNNWQLSKSLRAPAISRLQKVHNMEVVFKALQQQGINIIAEKKVSPRDVVDGHREKTLQLLWALIVQFQVNVLLNEEQLKEEIAILQKSLRVRNQLEALQRFEQGLGQKRRESAEQDLHMQNEKLALLLKWTRVVCAFYGIQIENFTVSFGDGRALCALMHHYHPALLPKEAIQMHTTMTYHNDLEKNQINNDLDLDSSEIFSPSPFVVQEDPQLYEQLLANEKSNFKLLYEKISELGGIPLMLRSVDMSNTIPDEKVVVTCVCYLCARLLDIRHESRAARVIQLAWRRYYLRLSKRLLQTKVKAAVIIQRAVRLYLAKTLQARQTDAVTRLQACVRGFLAKKLVQKMRDKKVQEHQHTAAIIIQKNVRRYLVKQKLDKMRRAVVVIQKMIRGHLVRQVLRKKHAAATCIQRWYRGLHLCRQASAQYIRLKCAAILIQTATRRWLERKHASRHQAAIAIQTAWRAYRTRREFKETRTACLVIQKYVRMHLAKRHYQRVRKAVVILQTKYRAHMNMRKQKQHFLTLKSAAITLQKYYRGLQSRRIYRSTLRSVVCLQSHMRGYLQRKKYRMLVSAALSLQRHVRAYQSMKRDRVCYRRTYTALVTIQSWWKMEICRRDFVSKRKSAVMIQSVYRMFVQRRRYNSLCQACLAIQHRYRALLLGRIQRRNYLIMCGAVITIQAAWRSHKCRENFKKQVLAVVLLQSRLRAYIARRNFLSQKEAAKVIQRRVKESIKARRERESYVCIRHACVTLQSAVRGMLARKRFQKELAARKIQSSFRGFIVRQEYQKTKKSVIKLQSSVRMYLARRSYRKLRHSVLMVQERYRANKSAHTARKEFLVRKGAAMTIQAHYKGMVVRRSVDRQHKAAILIQSRYRCHLAHSRYEKLKTATVTIQRWRRNVVTTRRIKVEFEETKAAVVKIQATYRRHKARTQYLASLKAIMLVQSWVKGHQQRKRYQKLKQVTHTLQTRFLAKMEGKRVRREYLLKKGSVITLQAAYRGAKVRQQLQRKQQAAVVIQKAYRCYSAKQKYEKLKQATTWIQNWYRSVILTRKIQNDFLVKKEAVISIQTFYRCHSERKSYLNKRNLIIRLQALMRSKLQQLSYLRLKQAAVVIQRRFRAKLQGTRARRAYLMQLGAALTIQEQYRAYQARKDFRQKRSLIVRLQARVRGKLQRLSYLRLRQATLALQRIFSAKLKGRQVRRQFLVRKGAVITLQAAYRGQKVRKQLKRYNEAATCIQSAYRCHACEKNFGKVKVATTVIQNWYRRILYTRKVKADFENIKKATVVIQKFYRGHRARGAYHKSVTCVVRLQSWYRGVAQRRHYQRIQWAASVVQCRYRAKLAGRQQICQYQRLRQATIIIQAAVRGRHECKKYRQLKQAAVCLQSRVRMIRDRRAYLRMKNAAVVCQRRWRATKEMRICMWNFLVKIGAVVSIQASYKAYKARVAYLRQYRSVIFIQSNIRRHLQQKRYRETRQAACAIQQRYRAHVAGKQQQIWYRKLKRFAIVMQCNFRQKKAREAINKTAAAVVIQKTFRMFHARTTFLRQKSAAVILQSHYRGRCVRRQRDERYKAISCIQKAVRAYMFYRRLSSWLKTRQQAVLTIQRLYRGHKARRQVKRIRAAVAIQSVWRMHKERQNYRQMVRGVIKFQSFVRGYFARRLVHEMRRKYWAAVCVQRAFRAHQHRLQTLEEQKRREFYVQRFAHNVRLNLSAVTVQRCYRNFKLLQKASQRLHSILIIQRWMRVKLCCLRRQRFMAALKTVQAWSRRYLLRRNASAVKIQVAVRRWLAEKHQSKRETAAITLQSIWRGRKVRMQTSKKIGKIRRNLEEATRSASEEGKLGNRTASALDYLLKYTQLSYLLEALLHLETSTRLSPACCRKIVEVNAVQVLFRLVKSCNRSQPHMEIIKYSVNILLNLAKYEKTVNAILNADRSIESLLDLMQVYREKGAIFTRTCTLLGIMGRHISVQHRQAVLNDKTFVSKIQSIHLLTTRKHRITETRNIRQAKLEAAKSFNCTLPLKMSHRPQQLIQPEWVLKRNSLREIADPLMAINFVMNAFDILPK